MKKFSFLIIFLVLFVNIMVNAPAAVLAKEPPVFNTEEILKDPLKDAVMNADLIVMGTITDQMYEIVTVGGSPQKTNLTSDNISTDNINLGKSAYTIFTLSVEKVIKGNPDTKKVLIKVEGGPLGGEVYQEPTGAYFYIADRILVLLHLEEGNVYTLPSGIVWSESPAIGAKSIVGLPESIGRIAKIMSAQDIPVVLNESIPMPAEPVKRPAGVKLPASYIPELKNNPSFELPESYKAEQEALLAAGWNNLMTENFEGQFPSGSWTVAGDPTWDDDDFKPHNRYWSAWCANGGTGGLDPQFSNYPNNMNGWMIYGPFDLSQATAAAVDFYRWNESELNYDYLEWRASADGTYFYGWQLDGIIDPKWESQTFDLSDVPGLGSLLGDSSVWIAFRFTSDSSLTYKGAFIDDIVLRANISGPRIDSISPTSGSAGTGTVVTINGQYFGATQGSSSVTFRSYYDGTFQDLPGEVQSWTDTQIKVVPVVYPGRSPCSGPLKVNIIDRGSDQRDFTVTFSYRGLKWSGTNPIHVPFEINPNTLDCTGEELAVIDAAQTWTDVYGANLVFDDGLTSTTDATPQPNGHNEIWWGTIASGNVAETQPYRQGNNLVECDIVFNDNYIWLTSDIGIPFTYDVQNIATHELGHWLYLMDIYGNADNQKTMYGKSPDIGETKKRTLEPEDIAGIQYIYPGEVPAVSTNAATDITSSSAKLNGTLSSMGSATTVNCSFQWGNTSGSYLNETTPPTSLSSPIPFSFNLIGLNPSTTYYYRAKAVGDGTSYGSEKSFTTLPSGTSQKLIGADDTAGLNESGNYILLTKFQAVATGQMTQFRVKSGATAQVKVAIYADNSGEPGGRLSYNNTTQNVVAGWNTLSIPALNVTSGTNYWLGIITGTTGGVQYISGSSSNFRYKAATLAGFTWPDTAGTGYSSTGEVELVAGWGATGTVPLSITTTSLPNAIVGVPYSQTLQATGGTGSYTWSITVGSLPSGLSLNSSTGVISGTPTTAGTSSFTAQVNDGSTTDTQPLSIAVTSAGGTQKLVGADDAAGLNESGNYILLTKFQAVATGQITEFKVKSGATAQVAGAIYADNNGEPGGRLSYNNSAQNVVAGWNTLSIPALNVTSGMYYWLGVIGNSTGAVQYISGSSSNFRYKAATFSTYTWPDPAGSGYLSTGEVELVAGWGATGAGQKLVGADDAAGLNESGNYILLTKFQAVATGQMTQFKVKSGATAQVKVAIYADNSGEPGGRLSYNNTAQNVVAGWNTLSIPALNITSGTYYWLGIITGTTGGVQYISGSSSNFRYKAATFTSFTWPDTAGTGYSSTGEVELVAGW